MKEIWKDIKGYESLYQVSNFGRVRSLPRYAHGRMYGDIILKPILKRHIGYYVVSLHKNGKQTQALVHRLVADAFCERQNGYNVVDHINTDTKDNKASNLRWTTIEGNVKNSMTVKHRTDKIRKVFCGKVGKRHPASKPVLQLTMDGQLVKRWECASDAVRECGFDGGSITHCCQGKTKYHKGFKWQYVV